MAKALTLQEVVELTKHLSLLDKVRLIRELALQIALEVQAAQPAQHTLHTPVRGLWKGLDITEEDIDETRAEMWGSFPRKDI